MDAKARIIQLIDDKQQEFIECSDAIWGYAETRFATRQSADAHIRVLENEGFRGCAGCSPHGQCVCGNLRHGQAGDRHPG